MIEARAFRARQDLASSLESARRWPRRSQQRVEIADEPLFRVPPELYLNRELSWLAFNERVLEEAEDPTNPLLERVKFLAIFSSNLDEFFMIRVANLKRKLTAGIIEPGPDGLPPQALAPRLREMTQRLLERQQDVLNQSILPELRTNGIDVLPVDALDRTIGRSSARSSSEISSRS